MDESLYVAADLGAGSGRVFLAGIGGGRWRFEELRRFHYPPIESGGHLRWDLPRMLGEVKAGLRAAAGRAAALGRRITSVGVDSWGVDYGLVDGGGRLVELPICYRDRRTAGVMEQVFEQVARREIVGRTCAQCLPFNTIYQLAAHARDGIPGRARRLLLIPDLLHSLLTGAQVAEFTNATTTQLVNARTADWDLDLADRLGLPTRLLAPIVPAGHLVGPLTSEVAREVGLPEVTVVAPATHDTGSAVAGTPLCEGWAYISSGTWSLVGIERGDVLMNDQVERLNFTNEGGAFGTVRFLKNVMGLWILESCRREWQAAGLTVSHDDLLASVAALPPSTSVIYPDDPRLFNPPSMMAALQAQLAESGQAAPTDPPTVTRMILDSLAMRYASVVRGIGRVTGRPVAGIHIVGGGSRNDYLNQATASASGVPVMAGPAEATAIGNVVVQAIADGRLESLRCARAHIREHVGCRRFAPEPMAAHESLARRYDTLESQFAQA
jgi:rhamnulokinase